MGNKILKNFDMKALMKERAKKANRSGVDLLSGINQIAPELANMKVGETLRIEIPESYGADKDNPQRSFLMQIRGKLTHLTKAGGEWEGRDYASALSPSEPVVYVQRGEDLSKPREFKAGAGRPPAAPASNVSDKAAVRRA